MGPWGARGSANGSTADNGTHRCRQTHINRPLSAPATRNSHADQSPARPGITGVVVVTSAFCPR